MIIMIIILILILLAAGESYRELHHFQVTVYPVPSGKLAGMKEEKRLVFLSDLHNCSYGEANQELLRAIREAGPDLILIGGDMLVRSDGNSFEHTVEFLSTLPDICEVYYANGNHEQKLKEQPEEFRQSYVEYKRRLTKAGIHFLENTSEEISWDNIKVRITGLEIPISGYDHFHAKKVSAEEVEERIGHSEEGTYQILLAHHPGYMEAYGQWGADLILSGHYHGGIVRIPGVGGVISPDFRPFPKYDGGIYEENGRTIVVSRGLGGHSIPVRLMNQPELIVLELKGR